MASGIQHQKNHRSWRWIAVVTAILAYGWTRDWLLAVSIPIGYWLGLYLDSDLDMTRSTIAENRWKNSYYFSWMLIWVKLYGIISHRYLGGHRSPLTHLPLLATALRMIWFALPIFLLIFGLSRLGMTVQWSMIWTITQGLFVGLTEADTVHLAADL